METNLPDLLRQLALTVKETIDEGISNGTIQHEEEVYRRRKVDKFQYTDKGITELSTHGEYITKPLWIKAANRLQESIEKSEEYSSALEKLATIFGEKDIVSHGLENFVKKIIHRRLYDSKFDDADIDALITTFLKDLRGEPVKCRADAELDGIILQPERIDIVDGIKLRQPKIEDLEKEYPAEIFMIRFLPHPSAILNIEFLGRQPHEIQRRVEHAVALFRLFKVGSVKYISYRMYSDSMTTLVGGILSSGNTQAALESYLITLDDVSKLKNFWLKVSDSIPKSFYDTAITKADYTTIAYNRYSDALLQNGILERRIANAVMGLESLFFKPHREMSELAYRLRIRVSKLLGLLGYDPYEVKEKIKEAYGIRSIFLHGGHLDYNKKKYEDIKALVFSVLDYLRISIVANLLIHMKKDEFIDLIDDSLIDRKKEEQLVSVISGAKEFMR